MGHLVWDTKKRTQMLCLGEWKLYIYTTMIIVLFRFEMNAVDTLVKYGKRIILKTATSCHNYPDFQRPLYFPKFILEKLMKDMYFRAQFSVNLQQIFHGCCLRIYLLYGLCLKPI